jgi:hypothetical protein
MNACRRVCGPTGLVTLARRYPADNPSRAMPVQAPSLCGEEERAFAVFADGKVDRPRDAWRKRDGDDLAAALAGDDESSVPALDAQGSDIGADGLRDTQSIEGHQRDQCMLGRPAGGCLCG